jgi:hypothetical protein
MFVWARVVFSSVVLLFPDTLCCLSVLCVGVCFLILLESLILAQDERWRRA